MCSAAQSCPTLCDPMNCSLPGSSVLGILQARIMEWGAMPSSRGFSQPRNRTQGSRNAVDWNSIPGSGRTPGGGHGNSLHYSCLENPKDKGAWWPIVHGIAKSQSQLKRLSLPTLLSEAHAFNSCAISIVQVLAWSTCEDWSRIAVS